MTETQSITLVRHGETDWNQQGRYQGSVDTPLNAQGIEQMQQTQAELRDVHFDKIISSNLQRAVHSAQIVAKPHGLDVKQVPALAELHLGSWEGQPYVSLDQTLDWFYDAHHGGERGAVFFQRINNWLHVEPRANHVLLVIHGLVIQMILSILLEQPFEQCHAKPITNGAVMRLEQGTNGWAFPQKTRQCAGFLLHLV